MTNQKALEQYNVELAYRAAYEGDITTLKELIELKGVNVNAKNEGEKTFLHAAALAGHSDIVNYLLSRRADANSQSGNQLTPLMFTIAAPQFKAEIAESLLQAGASLSYAASNGVGMLDVLTGNASASPEALRWLVSKGVDATKPSSTPGAAPILQVIATKNIPLIKSYIELGVDLSAVDNDGNSALHFAIESLKPEIVGLVLEGAKKQGIDLAKLQNKKGIAPIHAISTKINYPESAAQFNAQTRKYISDQMKIVDMLVEAGADINVRDRENDTALHIAASKGNEVLVPFLIKKGGNIAVHNDSGMTAFTAATSSNKTKVAAMLAAQMEHNKLYQIDDAALPKLNASDLPISLVGANTKLPVYMLELGDEEYRASSDAAIAPLQNYKAQREGNLLVVEGTGPHHKATYYSALNTYTQLTGRARKDAEKHIIAVSQAIEDLGIFNDTSSPASQYSTGYRALVESSKNKDIRGVTYLSASYYKNDPASFRYESDKEDLLKRASVFYSNLDLAGIGIAAGNDDNKKDKAAIGKSQPLRANAGSVFVGAAEKTADGTYLMKNYSERGPHITAPLPPLYNMKEDQIFEGTSFSTPAFNAYRLALFNGTQSLTPRELDAVLFTTASQKVVDDSEGKPFQFVSNGTVSYNDKVGMGVADIEKAYTRAMELDAQKKTWLKTKGEDKPMRLQLGASSPRNVTVGNAVKYEYSIPVTQDIYVQQFSSNTLTLIGSDGKPLGGQARIVTPNGFVQHARADVYGNSSLPAMFGMKFTKGDTITIISDQPLQQPGIDITGYAPNSFFAMMMNQEMAKQAAAKMKDVVRVEPCAIVASQVFNAKAASCAVR